jgi:hypothetical protein
MKDWERALIYADGPGRNLMRWNPYNSPAVLRALLVAVTERLRAELTGQIMTSSTPLYFQQLADAYCSQIEWRGVPLTKLVSVDCSLNVETMEATFSLRPLSEDGHWLLEQVDSLPMKEAQDKKESEAFSKGVPVGRIVEL